jgi:hypothetical protein
MGVPQSRMAAQELPLGTPPGRTSFKPMGLTALVRFNKKTLQMSVTSRNPGTDVMIFKTFLPKKRQQIDVFDTQILSPIAIENCTNM